MGECKSNGPRTVSICASKLFLNGNEISAGDSSEGGSTGSAFNATEMNGMKSQLQALQNANTALGGRVDALETQNTEMYEKVSNHETLVGGLDGRLEDMRFMTEELNEKMFAVETIMGGLNASDPPAPGSATTELDEKMSAFETSNTTIFAAVEALQAEVATLQTRRQEETVVSASSELQAALFFPMILSLSAGICTSLLLDDK